ncbi:hypothetical protein [Vitreimonas flagellata]|nr:hypothetical protein [Vitreimonas flagellata]
MDLVAIGALALIALAALAFFSNMPIVAIALVVVAIGGFVAHRAVTD